MAIDTIKFKRGNKNKLDKLSYGEPAYISDEGELYIGTESGVEKLTRNKEVEELSSQLAHKANKNDLTFINVKDFGVIGDGVTDDTDKFKLVLEYLKESNTNKGLYIPSGYYIINSDYIVFDNINIIGDKTL